MSEIHSEGIPMGTSLKLFVFRENAHKQFTVHYTIKSVFVFPKRRPIKTINTTQHQSGYIASNWTTHSSSNRSTDSTITLTGIPTLALVTIEFIYYELEDGLSCHNDSTMLVDTNSSCSLTIITHSGEDECLNLNSTHKTWSYLIVNETLSFSYKGDGRCKQSYKGFLFRYTVVGVEEDAGLEYSSTPLANIADLYTYWSTQDTPWDKGDNLTNLSTDSGIIKPSTV
ncbi:hypothetical protein EB796_011655 [Bugula neritina]|uniref:Uncharacterized protein n=1 Tax=Bugula neritina TaxID=10212 RepID=A0A7J7JVQ6_BUGNE|nr:hypothetical protein EB796_011655 [Bugula neritina]